MVGNAWQASKRRSISDHMPPQTSKSKPATFWWQIQPVTTTLLHPLVFLRRKTPTFDEIHPHLQKRDVILKTKMGRAQRETAKKKNDKGKANKRAQDMNREVDMRDEGEGKK